MKIALIGTSGFVGTAILTELLSREHKVTAIARNPETILSQDNLKIVAADIYNREQLVEILNNHDAVVSAFNPGWKAPNLYDDFIKGATIIQEAVKSSNVDRFIVIGGAGSLYVSEGIQLVDTGIIPEEWLPGPLAARDYLNIIREEKDLDWAFFSPAIEMHQESSGIRKGTYRLGKDNPVYDGNGKSVLSVEDVAVVIADELEQSRHHYERFTAAY